ncbi:effector-associated constant component EACC1 [Nonomuraea sp. CA-143628]|uniref:effector-associated constant component EACC1 n=1 Tax=Nonomuraea sp. CA-143628 TaxID=3239997 RepID=UPI003D942B27
MPAFAEALRKTGQIDGEIEVRWQERDERLGPIPELITVAAAGGGAVTIAIREIIRALSRRSSLRLKMTIKSAERVIEFDAQQLSKLSAAELSELIDRVAARVEAAEPSPSLEEAEPAHGGDPGEPA